jgi:cellulose biosynthesis protein BcsQ
MITAVVYSESGGTYKTTMTANLAVALERMGQNTLVIDLDPQEGNLTSLFDVGANRSDPDADNLVKHILDMPDGDFEDLIEETAEGVDIIPSHDMLGDFTSNLEQKISYETGMHKSSRKNTMQSSSIQMHAPRTCSTTRFSHSGHSSPPSSPPERGT